MTRIESLEVRQAQPYDHLPILTLLADSHLPLGGVQEWLDSFFVAETDGFLVGIVGLEIHGEDGILRSVAVNEGNRGIGIGGVLTDVAIGHARTCGVRRLFLLTSTAEGYFARRGFRTTRPEAASAGVLRSTEFRNACPTSAVAMVLEL